MDIQWTIIFTVATTIVFGFFVWQGYAITWGMVMGGVAGSAAACALINFLEGRQ